MTKLIDPDDGVVVEPERRRHHFLLFPVIVTAGILLAVLLWPPQKYDVPGSALVRPPVAEAGAAVPEIILSVVQGQPVGDEAFWKGFRLTTGWYITSDANGRYDLEASITNLEDAPAVAQLIVVIRVGNRNQTLLCKAALEGMATRPVECGNTNMSGPPFTSRWTRITISAL
jgi:hypothetical protein